ncbi:MAG: glutamyl-tRNA amidotransferase [Deltaproteobacteria bacterium]|nr:MAG: glutamyl-tRNA amidotransferase [Deltaproteobacteria bacterium]
MSKLVEVIKADTIKAMKAKEKLKVDTLRMVTAALQNKKIEKRDELTDDEVISVLMTLSKQRKDSIEQFKKGGRDDLADKESAELVIIQGYLPAQMSEEEVREVVKEVIAATGAASPGDMGKVMGQVMGRLKGKADGKMINAMVRELLGA